MSCNCPDNDTVRSQGRGVDKDLRGPFNIEPTPFTKIEADEHPEVLDSLPLGAMFFIGLRSAYPGSTMAN